MEINIIMKGEITMKKFFELPEVEVVEFAVEDVITVSGGDFGGGRV